jgi:hypothetical protein
MKHFFGILFLSLAVFSAKAQTVSYDSLRVSLLTVEPSSTAVYTVYGHTAMRLYDATKGTDVVLNWGMFDSHAPNFLYDFVRGETNYFFAAIPYSEFHREYSWKNGTITEQTLAIPNENKAALLQMLAENLQPENIEYRYNFLFDNCTTRPRDIIEKFCGGKLVYGSQIEHERTTFRNLIHSCTNPYPWMTFGIDLVIGSGADSLVSFRQELFLPERLKDALDHSIVITNEGEEYPLVLSSEIIVGEPIVGNRQPVTGHRSPVIIAILILLIYLALAITAYKRKRKFRIPFALLFLVAGIAGCLVTFLSFFSYHPCTQYNWHILWLHPFHFIGFAGFLFKKSYSLIRWFHASNFVLLSSLLLAVYWIPQQLNPASIPYILCLWVVSGYWLLQLKKGKA